MSQNPTTAVAPYQPSAAPPATTGLSPHTLKDAMELAAMMAKARLVPECLQNSPGDCLMVVEQSMRWGMSPFAVAQCTSSVRGKLMFEGKLVAAVVNSAPLLAGDLDYEFSGAGNDRSVKVTGKLKDGRVRDVTVKLADILTYEKDGSLKQMWKKQPDQQLVYGGARVWARRWTPQLMLGVYSPEEIDDAQMRDVTPPREAVTHQNAPKAPENWPERAEPTPPPAATFSVRFIDGVREFPRTKKGSRALLDALWAELTAAVEAHDALDVIAKNLSCFADEVGRIRSAAAQSPAPYNEDDDGFPGDTP